MRRAGILIISKRTLPRRTFLRGAGACDRAAVARRDGAGAGAELGARTPKRLGFIYMPNGVARNFDGIDFWTPKTTGKDFELSRDPDSRSRLIRISSRSSAASRITKPTRTTTAPTATTRARRASWLSGARVKRTEGADVENGVTADQIAAAALGKDTPLPSLELAIDLNFLSGQCENSYACIYMNTIAWRSPTSPLPTENNPRHRVRAAVRQRRHDRATRRARARESQHLGLRDRGLREARAHARPARPHASRQLSSKPCARSSAASRPSRA